MSASVTIPASAPTSTSSLDAGRARHGWLPASASLVWPLVFAVANATAFFFVRPNVGDLQAALARQSAAADGVGLTYWFQWFGGGAAPGNYSVVTPYLSSFVGAPLLGVLATVVITPLARRAVLGTLRPVAATWVATYVAAVNIWSGRIPFALGIAVAIVAVIGIRERRRGLAVTGIVLSSLCSPVSGAFVAFALGAAFLVEQQYRKLIFWTCAACGSTLLFVAIFFGTPGPQNYALLVALMTSASALLMLLARPSAPMRMVLWCTGIAAVLLALFPNGMGSNFERLPWICLPVAVVATASATRKLLILAVLPALVMGATSTSLDLVHSAQPAASTAYYAPLIRQLAGVPGLSNYRLEVVQNPRIHTAAYALLGHAALAGGYETQEENALNSVLSNPKRLDAISYKVWLDNNAVGYVAFNRQADANTYPEYRLVAAMTPGYLTEVSSNSRWTLYRVQHPTPIVAAPQHMIAATQAALTISSPCTCTFAVRVRYSKFLQATPLHGTGRPADIRDDGTGWTTVHTPRPGRYVLRGSVVQPLH